jgi:hypothetical protein
MPRIWTRSGCVPLLLLAASCTPVAPPGAGSSAGGELGAQCGGDFGASVAAQKLEVFLTATADFTGAAAELEASLISACEDMAEELEIPDSELQGSPGDPKVKAVCTPVSAKIEAELKDLRASAKLDVNIAATPPRCEAKVDAYADCVGQCEVDVDPGKLELQCEGGELRGQCDAECRGTCAAEVDGKCEGTCEGTCKGGCSGTCEGACDGKCSSTGANGSCSGKCDGTCKGECSAGCSGGCDGECVVKAKAECKGECRGECSVQMKEPTCTGEVRAPQASADCRASCDAKISAKAECKPGAIAVDMKGKTDSNIPEKAARLRAAIESGFGTVLAARAKLKKMGASGQAIVQTAGSLPNAIGELGLNAASCATRAAAALPRATASVSVSIEVSASLSASAGAG